VDPKDRINTYCKEIKMPTYKMILRQAEPPGTLAVEEDFCEAKNREEAQKIFEERHGAGRTVAGPMKVENPS
jgi:hypothetical protein